MEVNELTGIERELVLQYLIDGNVPVTVTPVEDVKPDSQGEIKPASSAVFPIAIKAEGIKVLEQGIILLTNPPENVKNHVSKIVRVEFYFNRIGLFFVTELKQTSGGLALVIPSSISRITQAPQSRPTDFSAVLYYSVNEKTDLHIDCFPKENYTLFTRPVWSDIEESVQHEAKSYLEEFIAHARKSGTAGNGVQLIPVVRYLAEEEKKNVGQEPKRGPLDILYVDYERIVFASSSLNLSLKPGTEYALEMSFPLPHPLKERKIFVTCQVEGNYNDNEIKYTAAVCRYTSIHEEDLRFLYEKCTNEIFV